MIETNRSIILASKSPRRQELLKSLGIKFTTKVFDTDESYDSNLSPKDIAIQIAQKKALPYSISDNTIIITADTIVAINGSILGKPKNKIEARQMLQQLSGNSHKVISSVCLKSKNNLVSFAETTQVFFKALTSEEIDYYIEEYKPFDKAGSYGIQEWIGMIGITKIEGSFYNVMGLPTQKLYLKLQKFIQDDM